MVVEVAASAPLPGHRSCCACGLGPAAPVPWDHVHRRSSPPTSPDRRPRAGPDHRRQLDLGVFEELLHPLLFPGPLPDQRPPIPTQITQLTDRFGVHQTGPHMPRSTTLANHTASSLSVFGRPGTFLTCLALSSQQGNPRPPARSTPASSSRRWTPSPPAPPAGSAASRPDPTTPGSTSKTPEPTATADPHAPRREPAHTPPTTPSRYPTPPPARPTDPPPHSRPFTTHTSHIVI